jgi:very-short-patch-repair endonuclease
MKQLREELTAEFDEHLFSLPVTDWANDFSTRFKGFTRILKGDYRSAMRRLRGVHSGNTKLTYERAREYLIKASEAEALSRWFTEARPRYLTELGVHFRGEETNWDSALDHLGTMQKLFEVHSGKPMPSQLKGMLLLTAGADPSAVGKSAEQLGSFIERLTRILAELNAMMTLPFLHGGGRIGDTPRDDMASSLAEAATECTDFRKAVDALTSVFRPGEARSPDEMSTDASTLAELQVILSETKDIRDTMQARFGHFFAGLDTDWENILGALAWTLDFRLKTKEMGADRACLVAACDADQVRAAASQLNDLRTLAGNLRDGRRFLVETFEFEAITPADTSLDHAPLADLALWVDLRIEHLGELSDWVQFQALRRESAEMGLDEFVDKVLEIGVPALMLEDSLRRRIAVLKLDYIYSQRPLLQGFQWRDHDDLVSRFKGLDKRLMKAFATLVRSRVAAGQPRLSSAGQAGFLRRELAKQRRHAPLRKLFEQCGNVILDITPCLMMSPLSVATYLPKHSVAFDLIVFDEASQVPAEEAVGAILRGNQLIVAGDPKQLPPTRFFERALDDGSDDYDDDADEAPLESMLEDCAAVGMNEAPLMWHYRSRHESLIAFSNAEFYGNSLITFPSPVEQAPDGMGVRLVLVEDGVYDRGRSRTNRKEAVRVSELVLEHCLRWGSSRSLGVIALSSAQEDAIREEMERLILDRPDIEPFLTPQGDEPFFVKPLENVQGDERDSIIMSIGYGKSPDGTMSLNFGPINQEGGERRLNVAVTRARDELLLVASIYPHDIDESRVTRNGPKLLKRYLQFAKEGRLPPETAAPSGESESEFEEAVWSSLVGAGLEVDRQVGCSRFRVDLAVKNPGRPGEYLLGIECDGDKYHRSRTARDRDRLRQEVLENLGWKIHRIWSTDWIRDPKGCLSRVLERLQQIESGTDEAPGTNVPTELQLVAEPAAVPELEGEPDDILEDDHYAAYVRSFTETPSSDRSRDDFYDGDDSDILEDILRVVSHEGPIHEDLLIQRVRSMYALKRTGRQVDETVRLQIDSATRGRQPPVRKVEGFLWPVDLLKVRPRRPSAGARIRAIEHVPPEEIEEAALLAARLARGVTEEELVSEIAQVLGYQRTGGNIDLAARSAIRRLLASGRMELRGSFLFDVDEDWSVNELFDGAEASESQEPEDPATALGKAQYYAGENNLTVIDRRQQGGKFWIVAGESHEPSLGLWGFRFAANGSRATDGRPAWWRS